MNLTVSEAINQRASTLLLGFQVGQEDSVQRPRLREEEREAAALGGPSADAHVAHRREDGGAEGHP